MAIDDTGKWWTSSDPNDLNEYLKAYSEESYPIDDFRLAKCECGSVVFNLQFDDDEGTARRICNACERQHFICDSGEFWEDANPEELSCIECASRSFNIGVGFALYEEKQDIKWIYIGGRCTQCGTLGCFTGWKVGYSPSLQLIESV